MKKLFLTLSLCLLACVFFTIIASAKTVYLEEIPDELSFEGDVATHFVVFEEEKYYVGSGSTIDGFNTDEMDADMAAAGIDSSKIGTEYLTRFNVPAYMGDTLITYVNLNSMKSHRYFSNKCGYVQLAGTVSKIHDMNEKTAQLRCFDFGENSQVTVIPGYFASSSQRLYSVKNFPKYLTVIESNAFNKCYNAFSGELYLNAVTIEQSAFNNCFNHVTGLVFGPDTKKIGNQSLCVRLSEVPNAFRPEGDVLPLKYIEFQCDVSEVNFATQNINLGTFYFIGTDRSPYSNLECIILSHPNNASQITEGSVFNDFLPEGTTVLFNDSDGLNDFVYASHSFTNSTLSYESFLEAGGYSATCDSCGYSVKHNDYNPIFVCLGFSASTYSNAFTVGYSVNFEAKSAYEEATGLFINYGFVVAVKSYLGSELPLDSEGNAISLATGAVINVRLTPSTELFYGTVGGFTTEEQKSADIVICAYATTSDSEGNVTSVEYLQEESMENGLFATSYNSVIGQ